MTNRPLSLLPGLCTLLLLSLPPSASFATTRVVDPDTAHSCDADPVDPVATPPCYRTITAAMNAAISGDAVVLEPAVYSLSTSIGLPSGVSLQGRETARTILSGTGSSTIITAANINALSVIRNLTFTNAAVGIAVTGSTQLDIANNIFRLPGGTGISTQSSAATAITNNTFYDITTAIATQTDTTLNIINNIFSAYTTPFPATIESAGILNNLFTGAAQSNVDTSPTGNRNIVLTEPLFADLNAGDAGDFHLRDGSPAIDAGASSAGNDAADGTTPDIGAYGGSRSDTIPFPVSGLIITASDATSITVSWNTSTDYRLAGYNVYYGTVPGTYGAAIDAGLATTWQVTGLSAATGPTAAPALTHTIGSQMINLWWTPVSGATGYEIRSAVAPSTPPLPPSSDPAALDVGNTIAFQLTGLTNGTTYNIVVVPYAEAVYSIIVKAYYVQDDGTKMSAASNVVSQSIGGRALGAAASNMVSDFPEVLVPLPNLPNSGCFIATAAYGSSSASQVQALRIFRDRYLLTNAAGRAFVRWYYRYGPIGARFLDDHPACKPVVRAALLPAVGGAVFLTRTTLPEKTLALLVALTGIVLLRSMRSRDKGGLA